MYPMFVVSGGDLSLNLSLVHPDTLNVSSVFLGLVLTVGERCGSRWVRRVVKRRSGVGRWFGWSRRFVRVGPCDVRACASPSTYFAFAIIYASAVGKIGSVNALKLNTKCDCAVELVHGLMKRRMRWWISENLTAAARDD